MQIKSISVLLLIYNLIFVTPAISGNFVSGMEDVPLMSGMQQITQDDISFGNEEVRLLEAYFTAKKLSFKQICNFYKESLPQLGWIYQGNRENSAVFYREGETLDVVRESVSPLVVRITVKSKP